MTRNRSLPLLLDLLAVLVLAGTAAVTASVYDRLPDPMPSHFGIDGRVNGWLPESFGAWLLPMSAVALAAFLRLVGWLAPTRWSANLRTLSAQSVVLVVVTMLCALHFLILRTALDGTNLRGGPFWVLFGISFVVIGQLMKRVGRNPFIGFRTKWSLASDENWDQAQRVGAKAFTIGGFSAALLGALGFPVLAVAATLGMAIGPLAWSWKMSRRGA